MGWLLISNLSTPCLNTNHIFKLYRLQKVQQQLHIKYLRTFRIVLYSYTILTLSIGVTLTGYCTKCADKDTHEVDKLYHRLSNTCSLWLYWSDYTGNMSYELCRSFNSRRYLYTDNNLKRDRRPKFESAHLRVSELECS